MIKVAEESTGWLAEAATYCTTKPDAADIDIVFEDARQAVKRVVWCAGMVLAWEPRLSSWEIVDLAEVETLRRRVVEARQKAESANTTCQQVQELKRPSLLTEAQRNQLGNDWNTLAEKSSIIPQISVLSLASGAWEQKTSQLAIDNYHHEGVAVVYQKFCDLFAEAHYILQTFCGHQPVQDLITVEHDSNVTEYPEVFLAWKAQGGDDWPMTIAKCKQLKRWGVGFAGKKNGEKAAKLALCLSIAGAVAAHKLETVVE